MFPKCMCSFFWLFLKTVFPIFGIIHLALFFYNCIYCSDRLRDHHAGYMFFLAIIMQLVTPT